MHDEGLMLSPDTTSNEPSRYGRNKPPGGSGRYVVRSALGHPRLDYLTFPLFRGRIKFRLTQGRITSIKLEDRVNRRRILAGIVSVVFLGLVALFLPSLHKTAEPAAPTMQPVAQPPTETAATPAESELPSIPTPVLEAKAAPLPPASRSAA